MARTDAGCRRGGAATAQAVWLDGGYPPAELRDGRQDAPVAVGVRGLGGTGVESRAGLLLVVVRRHAAGDVAPQARAAEALGQDVRVARPAGLLPEPGQRAVAAV